MKKIITLTIAFVIILSSAVTVNADSKSDLKLAKQWAKARYDEPIKIVKEHKVPAKRKGTVYIEKVVTKSVGGYKGRTTGKHKYSVRYPKKVKKGKKVTVYFIWNPKNNACDDIVAMICLGIVKGDNIPKKKTISKVTNKATSEPEPKEEPIPIETCPYCEEPGKCVYWVENEQRHMTPEEIEEFEWLEWHYQDEDGNWIER